MRFTLQNCRLAFGHGLFEASRPPNTDGDLAYNCRLIIPPDHPQFADIEAALVATAREKWGAKADAILAAAKLQDLTFLHNGDSKPDWVGFPGNFFISARSKIRPSVLDRNKSPVTKESGTVYSGCYGIANLEFFGYDKPKRGLSAQIRGFMKTMDADAFGGGTAAGADEFPDLADQGEAVDPLS